jgi:hypothetical protein
MIRYHGTPITPERVARHVLDGRHGFVSFAHPKQIGLAAGVCESFALDNGAFSAWRRGAPVTDWRPYYAWCSEWLTHPGCDWAVIPDVIGGTEADNDRLVEEWPHGHRGVPVWHLDESVDRLVRLVESGWPRVALGSAAEFDVSRPAACLGRLADALPEVCDQDGRPRVKLHGLRMMRSELVGHVPLASADSTAVARNIGYDVRWPGPYAPRTRETRADVLLDRMAGVHAPGELGALLDFKPQPKLWEDDE